jgi:hypothetical protein
MHYKDDWCLGDLYGRLMNWSKQQDEHSRKVKTYEKEKIEYNTFCKQKLKQTPIIKEPTSKEKEESKELRKLKANEKKFIKFASKHHPNHPA